MTNGGIIKAIRKQQGITQVQLAREIRVDKATLVKYENDDAPIPDVIIERLSCVLGVDFQTRFIKAERVPTKEAEAQAIAPPSWEIIGRGRVSTYGKCPKCGKISSWSSTRRDPQICINCKAEIGAEDCAPPKSAEAKREEAHAAEPQNNLMDDKICAWVINHVPKKGRDSKIFPYARVFDEAYGYDDREHAGAIVREHLEPRKDELYSMYKIGVQLGSYCSGYRGIRIINLK